MKIFDRQRLITGPALLNYQIKKTPVLDFVKRVMDPVIAIFFIVGFLPLWIIIALSIKLDSKGPIIFSHQRVGKNGQKFRLYKFRTMYSQVEPQAMSPLQKDDPRITKFGRILRRTGLDEAPQFCNVLKGEMSIIGPRPEMPFIVEHYQDWQKRRLEVKPGITGLWQVLASKNIPLKDNLDYDFYYLQHRSMFLELVILAKTVIIVVTGKGAY